VAALTGQYYSFNASGYAQGGTLLVRWGPSLPAKPYVFYDNNGVGFDISNGSYLTVRGLTIRCHRRSGVNIAASAHHIVIQNNRVIYDTDIYGNGSGYGIGTYGATNITIADNEIAWTDSEGIHTQAAVSGATVFNITGNWIHDNGDQTVLGPHASGTPSGMILTDAGGGGGSGDYTGSILENNLIQNQKTGQSIGRGVILENHADGWVIRNNVFSGSDGEGLKLDANGVSSNNNQIYNNLFMGCGAQGGGPALHFNVTSSTKSANNNKVYNNTFVNNVGGAIQASCAGPCTGNEFRNNILFDSGSRQLMNWVPGGIFQNNLLYATGTQNLMSFNGRSYNCAGLLITADIDGDGVTGDNVRCANPLFVSVSGNDVHLTSASPAKDSGTSSGVPSGRTASIYNTVAQAHGLPAYADNLPKVGSAWDIGAIEYGSLGISAAVSTSSASPLKPGSYTVTLTTSTAVVQLPGPVAFLESDASITSVSLTGTLPGTVFTGVFLVDSSVSDGPGTFSLPANNLRDASGNTGNTLTSGALITIDKAPPSVPANLRFGN
jgi:hypothetical protein